MHTENILRRRWLSPVLVGTTLSLAAFVLYWLTLAPTILWGDDAELARVAAGGAVEPGLHTHPLWVGVARAMVSVLGGDPASRTNLLSAFCAALAVGLTFAVARMLTHSTDAATLGALALAVSHTFWGHAVRTEVYAMYCVVFLSILALVLLWDRRPRDRYIVAVWAGIGAAVWCHSLISVAAPAIAVFLFENRTRVRLRSLVWGGIACAALTATYAVLFAGGTRTSMLDVLGSMTRTLLHLRPADVLLPAGFLAYQFPLALVFAALGSREMLRTTPRLGRLLVLLFAGPAAFTMLFAVADRYVFMIPAYVICALWIARGVATLPRSRGVGLGLTAAIVLAPPIVYRAVPIVLNARHAHVLATHVIPFRDNNTYFLYPPKNGNDGARRYAHAFLAQLKPDALVLADWTVLAPLEYAQAVEHVRPDVSIVESRPDSASQAVWVTAAARTRPLYFAEDEPAPYYDHARLGRTFRIVPLAYGCRLDPRSRARR